MMNCDDVFDRLTSPEGDDVSQNPFAEGQLKRHLARCASCRELAGMIQPAVVRLRESCGVGRAVEHHELPVGPWAQANADAPQPRHQAAATARRRARPKWAVAWWPMAAVALLGVALGGWLQDSIQESWVQDSPADGQHDHLDNTLSAVEITMSPGRTEGQIRLVSDCLPEGARSRPVVAALVDLVCCTRCHHAAVQNGLSAVALNDLAASCRFCHAP